MNLDDMTRAILEREEVARYLRGTHGETPPQARERIYAYLDELRTTQRYPFYRALKHPLYPILRKVHRVVEHIEIPQRATAEGRVIYASNHRSHIDYLVEPLVLDDNGIRPPLIAAGINLFGGPLGLLHRHVTGAIPIRRNTKDPAYLITLKAYVAELLLQHDLLFYFEGGRSYNGELKPPKTGLIQAALHAERTRLRMIPTGIAYDLVLEDRSLARQGVKRHQRPFTREIAEMVGAAVGYRSRAVVTFGEPIDVSEYDAQSRRGALDLAHRVRDAVGLLCKVMPTSLVASAMRPSITRRELEQRVAILIGGIDEAGGNLETRDAARVVEAGTTQLRRRAVIAAEDGRFRVRDRTVLRYYARTVEHLLGASRR